MIATAQTIYLARTLLHGRLVGADLRVEDVLRMLLVLESAVLVAGYSNDRHVQFRGPVSVVLQRDTQGVRGNVALSKSRRGWVLELFFFQLSSFRSDRK